MIFNKYFKEPTSKIIVGIVVWYALFHFTLTHLCRDDMFYRTLLPSFNGIGDFVNFFVERYLTWSSRTLADILSAVFTSYPIWIWQLLNICVYTLIIVITSRILELFYKENHSDEKKENHSYVKQLLLTALFFILLFPIFDMKTAEWVTTSINYLWTLLAFLSFCFYLLKSFSVSIKCRINTVIFFISVIYACTFELLAVMTVLFLAFVLFIKIREKLSCRLECIAFLIAILFLFYHLLCPGNLSRSLFSVNLFSSWNSMNIVEHINIALCSTYARLTSFSSSTGIQVFLLYFIFNLLILISLHKKYKDPMIDLVFLLPFVFTYLFNQTDFQFESIEDFSESVSSFSVGQFRYTYQPILSILLFGMNITGLFLLFMNKSFHGINCGFLVCLLYIVSLGTRLALGLSPSVYASSYRTYIIIIFVFIIFNLVLLNELDFFKWLKNEYSFFSKNRKS